MRTRKDDGTVISGEKAMSDKDWENYNSEIRTGYRWGVTYLVIGLGVTGVMLIQRVVEAILG